MFASKDLFFTNSGGYKIQRSVRTRLSASASFTKTFGTTATSAQKLTYSGWIKRGSLGGAVPQFFGLCGDSGDSLHWDVMSFQTSDCLRVYLFAAVNADLLTVQVFRDPSAWYHIVVAVDTTQATASNRMKLYVNGVQITAFTTATYPALNSTFPAWLVSGKLQGIGFEPTANTAYFDGYMAEVNVIDGQQLTPSSFGSTNAVTGVWQPIKYTGTYGTNGFYINFSDNSAATATTIGKDYSGNGNNWTPNNISVTAGVTYDSMLDVPTPYADGGNGRGNYCVLNPLSMDTTTYTLSNANLNFAGAKTATGTYYARSTLGVSSGKWYWEITPTDVGGGPNIIVGIQDASTSAVSGGASVLVNGYGYNSDGTKQNNTTQVAYAATWTNGDVIGVALDLDAGTIVFYKNNTSQGTAFTGITSATYCPVISMGTGGTARTIAGSINFGQRPFSYTPPTGFVALNTQNLPTPTISNGAAYMAATIYTGTGASLTIANTVGSASFYPDFVWVKGRSGATDHALYDSVRGTTKDLVSNSTAAETTQATGLTAFGSTGFTVGALAKMNTNAATYVGWQWLAGAGSSSSNTSGSITSTVSVGATQGFSVVTYTGTGANATVGHGLGVAPSMIFCKNRNSAQDWIVYHTSLGNTKYLGLNTTTAAGTASTVWNNTSPTSTVFSLGSAGQGNGSTNGIVAYCFAAVAGYSAFGSYTGNGSADGPFVYCGFRPRYLMIKRSDSIDSWVIEDSSRNTYNVNNKYLLADSSGAESTGTPPELSDFLSNGFKKRSTNQNTSGGTYIFMAFAENPFKLSLAR